MNKQPDFTFTEMLLVVVISVITIGWVWNIIKLFNVLDDPFSARIVFRMLGILFIPLGAIMGYF